MESLEQKLGYGFKSKDLLKIALTHSSYANERGGGLHCNERLEFLGDSILGFVAAKNICRKFPDMPEGEMTRLRAELVCEASLYRVAESLGLSSYILLGKNEECNGGRERHSIQADCVEALIAAVFLDGGLESAESLIEERILSSLLSGEKPLRTDYKTQLQELVQKNGDDAPGYEIVAESGPDHDKTFTARVTLPDGACAEGTGKTKKEAEQMAAKAALEHGKR